MTASAPHFRPILALLVAAFAVFADPTPYDSIANPLDYLPATNPNIQRIGDSLNLSPNRVRVNQAGYRLKDVAAGYAKFYYVGAAGVAFDVVNAAGAKVASGSLVPMGATVSGQINPYASNSAEHQNGGFGDWKKGYPMTGKIVSGALMRGVIPATVPAGKYIIKVGADTSVPFIVSDNVYAMARDAALKFFGVARSGDYESWFHPPSHMWDGWLYDSAAKNPDGTYKYKGALKGGWYDCGNHLKEARTISYPLATLGMLAATMPEKDADEYALNQNVTLRTDGIPDVLREAWVGTQFVFNSWRLAKGKASDMILSVGDPGPDFGWWGRPENHDNVLSPRRGGRRERVLLKNWGSGSMGDFAAGLAFVSRLYRRYDPVFADSALTIAKAMYEEAKRFNNGETAPDYSGDGILIDDMALGAVALLWATRDPKYLGELTTLVGLPDGKGGVCPGGQSGNGFELQRFEGGFLGCGPNGMLRQMMGPTDYGTVNALVLYSFAKLILTNADTARNYGISSGRRDTLLLRSVNQLIGTHLSGGAPAIVTPAGSQYNPAKIAYDSIWYRMDIGSGKTGWWNKYQFGNLADLYLYYDMTSLVEGRTIVNMPGNTDWKRKEVLQVLLGGLNYMFGTNALDVSYLYGIGRKNPMHPHHRSSNPEGKNVPGAYYNYTIPVGGLYGGILGGPTNTEVLDEYFDIPVGQTEANCPDAQAVVMIPLMGLASESPVVAPRPTVKVLYTTDTMAVVQIDLDKWGWTKLGYGLDSSLSVQTKIVNGSDTGNSIRVVVTGLKPATQYYFHVVSTDLLGLSSTVAKWPNGKNDSIPFSFTTKAVPPVPPQFGNIKVCNVTSDSAEIMWYTPNGEYFSSVLWADSASWKIARYQVTDSDMVGNVPVKFHHVKLYGLKPKTTYNFKVGVPGSYDATVGCFRTPNEDVKFEIKTTRYSWGGQPAMGIAVVNQDVKDYDSLQIRLYVNGTTNELLDLAARVDIAFKYRSDGFIDSGLFVYTKNVSRSRPKKIDPTCPDASVCAWYFDLPMYGATMESQARWRLDVVFDKHLLERDSTDILNLPPTHDPFGGTDWSFRKHVAGADNGLSPLDYDGVPLADKEDIDKKTMDIPVNPYIAVYRRNEFVYGFSPFAKEQATKRTVYAMNAAFDKPFDVSNGNTIEIGTGTSTRLKGVLDPYDVMMPAVKGYITSVWVNGVALTDAERKAALGRRADGTWNVDLPMRFVTGTNKVDVTFFAGSDSVESVNAGTCGEGKGCAFYNANWYVNYVSNLTPALLSVVDGFDKTQGLVTPDSSSVRIRVKDGNASLSKTAIDSIKVKLTNLRTGTAIDLALPETGANTGVFQTDLLMVVSGAATAGKLQLVPGDTLVARYADAADSADSSSVRIWSKAAWPTLVSGVIYKDCGSGGHVAAMLDGKLGGGSAGGSQIKSGQIVVLGGPGDTLYSKQLSATEIVVGSDGQSLRLDVPVEAAVGVAGGVLSLVLDPGNGKTVTTKIALDEKIGPWIDSAKIVENLSGSPVDTVYVWSSEPVKSFGNAFPVVLQRAGVNVPTTGIVVDSAWVSDPVAGRWTFAVRGGVVRAGDSLRWNPHRDLEGLISDPVVGERLVFKIESGSAAPDIRDSLVVTRGATSFRADLYLRGSRIPEHTDRMAYQPASHRLFGHNDSLNYDYWISLDTIPGKALEWYLYPSVGLLGPNVWKLSRIDNLPGVTAASVSGVSEPVVADLGGNSALDCPSMERVVKLVSRPAPFSRAWISDADGDGRADRVTLVFRKILTASDLPDSIVASFGATNAVRSVAVRFAMATDSVLTVPLATYPLSDTRGSAANGAGSLSMWKSGERTGPYDLVDSVGPALLSARLRYGNSGKSDTLELDFSEPVRRSTGTGWLVLQPAFELGTAGAPDSLSATRWKLPVDTSVVDPGDSVRPIASGKWADQSTGRKVAAKHPWVVVVGGERAPVGGWFQDADGDGAVDRATVSFGKTPRTRSAMLLLWPSKTGFDTARIDSGSWTLNADGRTMTISVGPFTKGVTSTSTNLLGRWTSAGTNSSFPMTDSVPAVIVSATVRYASTDGTFDTLKVRWSESITWNSGSLVFHKNVARGQESVDVPYVDFLRDADGLGASLLLDTMVLSRGDSARLAPTVSDLLGNIASDTTVWVPVTFGVRPPRLDAKLHPMVHYDSKLWQFGTGAPLRAWVRERGDDKWLLVDGSEPEDTTELHFLGVTLTLNQMLDGSAHIFDNGGTFVVSMNFDDVREAAEAGVFVPDEAGMYQVRLAWDGRTAEGKTSASGVYFMRLVLKYKVEGQDKPFVVNRVYGLGFKHSVK